MVRAYALLAWTWTRTTFAYPVTAVLLTVSGMIVMGLDLAVILIMFSRVSALGGFSAHEVLFLYGTSQVAFGTSDALLGTTSRLGQHLKAGSLDTMLIRPVSPLVQLATEDFTPRRVARFVPSWIALGYAMAHLPLTPLDVLLTLLMVCTGTVIFCAIWVLAAAVQFALIDGHEATKAVTWGGGYMTQYPMSVYGREFLLGVTFAVPLAFVNWLPSLHILGHPDPLGLPSALRFAAPLVAALLCAAAALAWRTGLRHYRSTGS